MNTPLSILCQSPVSNGISESLAINQTLELAKLGDELGYKRIWFSEHHNTNAFASASPEIMMTAAAAVTSRIRVGSGGVLINNHVPYKIAEQFRTMQAIYGDRIDLGLGRSSGGDLKVMKEFSSIDMNPGFEKYDKLFKFLQNKQDRLEPVVHPIMENLPEIWILGTSPVSAEFAAKRGLPFCFGSFIDSRFAQQSFESYHRNFVPGIISEPYTMLASFLIASSTTEEAIKLSKSAEIWFVKNFLRKLDTAFPEYNSEFYSNMTDEEKFVTEIRTKSTIIDEVDLACERLTKLEKLFQVNEHLIITITYDFHSRLESYKLLANAWGLK